MKKLRPNIAFAGLTAAGKTTHAKILADQLCYEYISATKIILDILNMNDDSNRIWLTKYNEIEKAREGDRVDVELEKRLIQLANTKDGLVIDSWALAYIYEGPLIRIWIESDKDSRSRKCFVSQKEQKNLDINGCRSLVTQKDNDTREKFLRRLKFDLFSDMSKYDAIICNSDLIKEPTDHASTIGIKTFTPVVRNVISYLIRSTGGDKQNLLNPSNLNEKYGSMVTRVNKIPWSYNQRKLWKH